MRVAAGAIARKIVPGMTVRGALIQMGPRPSIAARWDWDEVERNPFFCPDAQKAAAFFDDLSRRRAQEGLVGRRRHRGRGRGRAGRVSVRRSTASSTAISPAAMMGINAVKGVEIGAGIGAAALTRRGQRRRDAQSGNDGKPTFLSNHAGGILGGISTGQPIVVRFAVKPTSSILTPAPRPSTATATRPKSVTKGRHDPCVGIRAVPIGEAMVACVIADHYLRHRGQVGESRWLWPFTKTVTKQLGRSRRKSGRGCLGHRKSIEHDRSGHRRLCPRRDRRRHRRRRPRERGRPVRRGVAVHAREDGLHHPPHLGHRLRAAGGRRRRSACISIRWWRRTTRRSAPPSPSRWTCATA